MNVLLIKDLQKKYDDRVLFEKVNVAIHRGERVGIVGRNGSGKTTLAKILIGDDKPDKGSCEVGGSIGYLRQSTDHEPVKNEGTRDHYSFLRKREKELGLSRDLKEGRNSKKLSGGERLKLSLAQVSLTNPDLLILDEPTNHLDSIGVQWLIRELENYKGAVLVISHDRYFLDQTVHRILEIENGELHDFSGNYTAYRHEKKRRYEEQLHRYRVREKEKKRIEEQLAGLTNWSDQAHRQSTKQEGYKEHYRMKAKKMDAQVKSKRKRLEKQLQKSGVNEPPKETGVRFQFESENSRGKRIFEAINVSKQYDKRWLFKGSSFYIKHGERVGMVGENGCGKTTFLRMILGEEEVSGGEIWKSPMLKIGYLSQDVHDLASHQTALQSLEVETRDEVFRAKSILASMGMERSRVNVPIQELSLGERTKVKMTRLLMNKYDVLILDEPTNHLDLSSREQLEDTLQHFKGTLLVVSHDHYFMDKICERLLVFKNQNVNRLEMSLSELREKEKSTSSSSQQIGEKKMLLDNEISALISEISLLMAGDPRIAELDKRLNDLYKEKRAL
ncbi:ribosomal protection-like ABC-F family protein [Guptibacillus hwajinpoensis]|uniref:Macrolide transport system ATP-binding/permease protein n=1 Tax=Guptibacillus hwajinpoensis TaxID=208199 RepID=A0ABU0K763_9BACL|nr:ABC-F type ribosomal protection protein [Alkalihalobacillus hemicentroti]MDQ0484480.1 macrolide transport system ATP-binding/permease protein [Alkalihalobacillus hemicentroti]